MRILNILHLKGDTFESLDSFPIYDEQLSQEIALEAEELFKKKLLQIDNDIPEVIIEEYIENGVYYQDGGDYNNLYIIWSYTETYL